MNRENQVKVLFLAVFAGAGLLYWTTAADGYPWSASTHWALAWSGVLPELPHRLWPVWGYFVQVFGGHYIALSVTAAALAVALLAAVVNRHFGWRVAVAASVFFAFSPRVWNAAVTGGILASVLFAAVAALVFIDVCCVTRWLKSLRVDKRQIGGEKTLATADVGKGRRKGRRIAAWVALGASVIFALASLTQHDYSIGEDATAYAADVLKDADGKWLVLSGVADDQFYAAVRDGKLNVHLVSLRRDDLYRRHLVRHVKASFTNDVELVAAAEIGPQAFVTAARKRFPDLFVMTDMRKTAEKLEKSRPKDWHRREPSMRQLVEWNNEMIRSMEAGETDRAGRLARTILAVPRWNGFVPALAILGTLTGAEGDFAASERFFRAVTESGGDLPPVACNDFAETLRQLKKYDEAEAYARKAVAATGAKNWVVRLTLAQVMADAGRDGREIVQLIQKTLPYVPEKARSPFDDILKRISWRTSSAVPNGR